MLTVMRINGDNEKEDDDNTNFQSEGNTNVFFMIFISNVAICKHIPTYNRTVNRKFDYFQGKSCKLNYVWSRTCAQV